MACRRRCEARHVETKGNAHYFIHTTNQMATPFTCLTSISFLFKLFHHFLQLQPNKTQSFHHLPFTTYHLLVISLSHTTHSSSPSSSSSSSSSSFPFCHLLLLFQDSFQQPWKSLRAVQVDHQSPTWLRTTS